MKTTLNILLLLFFTSCSSQEYLEDGNFDLEKINLRSFNSKKFFSNSLNTKWSEYREKVKNNITPIYFFQAVTDTIDNNGSDPEINKPYGIIYRLRGIGGSNTWEKDFCVAKYNSLKFDELNTLTDIKNNTILVCAYKEQTKKTEIVNIIKELNNKYGDFELSEHPTGFTKSDVRKWDTGNVIISVVSNVKIDFKNEILKKKEEDDISKIESEKLNSIHLFFTKKESYNQIKEMKIRIGFMTYFED